MLKVRFHKGFYGLSAVKKSIDAYKDISDFKIKKDKNSITVTLFDFNEELTDTLADEFSNYVLFMQGEH